MRSLDVYRYLVRARRDLWAALEAAPDEVLSRPMLEGSRLHSIKDLVFHTASVEDGWVNEDILARPPVLDRMPLLKDSVGGPVYGSIPLAVLLDYWRAVQESTLGYLEGLTDEELRRVVTVHDSPEERFYAEGLLWHVMIHEMRHTAQIAMLLRMQGIQPPSLDLLFYLPPA